MLNENYRVLIQKMKESHRTTYWVTLINVAQRPWDAKVWDSEGRITPFMHENLEYALIEAENWAMFLGTTMEEFTE